MRGTIPVGRVLGGRYVVRERLGEGGWGAVYAATQMDLGRPVAVKVLHTDVALSAEGLARFAREARAAAALGHPNIVQVTDFQANPGEPPFLVMEMLSGRTLASALASGERMPVARVAWIAHQVLAALDVAHRAGIVHRDVKPDNVFLVSATGVEDFVKLLDFGIAKLADDGQPQLTASGAMVGSPAYMAPEQIRGMAVDGRADLYALGATMYRALTGHLPFEATSLHALLFAITEKRFEPVVSREPSVHPVFAAVVERALHKEPGERFASAAAMRAALEPWTHATPRTFAPRVSSGPPLSGPTPPPARATAAPPQASPLAGTATPARSPGPAGAHGPYGPGPAVSAAPTRSSAAVVGLLVASLVGLLVVVAGVAAALFVARRDREPAALEPSPAQSSASTAGPVAAPPPPSSTATVAVTATAKPPPGVRPASPGASRGPSPSPADAGVAAAATSAPPPEAADAGVAVVATSAAPTAGAPLRKQYAGASARVVGGSFGSYPIAESRASIARSQPAIDACYAATEHEPPDHQFVSWTLQVDGAGRVTAVRPTTTEARHAKLDACMAAALRTVRFPPVPVGSEVVLSFGSRTRDNP